MSFISFLKAVGHDFKKGLDFLMPWALGSGAVAVSIFAPALGPLYNQTALAVMLAEQKAAALNQSGSGPQKLKDVIQILGPVISQGLKDAGQESHDAAVTAYINSIVQILNAAPAPAAIG